MKPVIHWLGLLALVHTASAAYVAEVYFADDPTQLVTVAISAQGTGLKDFEEYLDLNAGAAGSTTGSVFMVGIGTRVEITSCTVSNGRAHFAISASKKALTPRLESKAMRPGYQVQEINTTLSLPLNQWMLWRNAEGAPGATMISEDRNALPGSSGMRIREAD